MAHHITTIHPFDPWGTKTGGIETFIRALIRHSPPGITHSLIGVSEDLTLRPLHQWHALKFEGTQIQFLPILADTTPNKRSWVPLFLRFPLQLRNTKLPDDTDVILFHRIEPVVTCPKLKAPNVLFIHGNPIEITGPQSEVKWKYIPWLYKLTEKKAVSTCSHAHVVSRSGLQYLQQQYPSQSDHFLFQPTGYDESIFNRYCKNSGLLKQHHLNPTTKKILFAGRLEAQKNPLPALKSFFQLREQVEAQLIIAGDGSLLSTMRKICDESAYSNDVLFLGRINSISLAEWMNTCDIFLMTSHFEGMPITVLEALACGLPVVSTNVGEISQIINHGVNGKIVSNPTVGNIANSIHEILHGSEQYPKTECTDSVKTFRNSIVMDTLYQQLISHTKNS